MHLRLAERGGGGTRRLDGGARQGHLRRETLQILRDLTDRLPNGTWLLALRLEGRKVDIEGLSPSASEIFPALTRDGRFRSVEFGAPITRQADNIERFKIRGEYVTPPPAPASPPAGAVR